ncbi:LADA_0B05644g1_1 [Lachancea dasiensis]|uniref:LADA_0B05644g1_1 n=1 Tax=Lachancea dasiensis TaxID=1072105 RepID=A0A1G4ITJ2_9SACH|nr:LADA_0B05644g1_1 [Lachancea dasiensis]
MAKLNKKDKSQGKGPNVNEHGVILVPPPKSVPNKEHMQRLNYLFQLSTFHTMANDQDQNRSLSRMYIRNLDLIQKKTKSALTPSFKRQICKSCHRVLIPTKTMTQQIINESKQKTARNDVLVLSCECGVRKRFPVGLNPGYQPHVERVGPIYMSK